jgi:hypothetical protein
VGVPAHFLAAGGPILVSISLVLQQLPAFSLRRIWGQFLGGLWLVPPIVLALELLALIPFILAAAIVLASFPEGMRLLDQLGELSEMPPDRWMPVLEGFLSQPLLLVLIGLFIALVVPILEEIWKSISIWPILGRRIHRLDGFLGGVLGGAGYALTETLLLGSPGEEWVLAMLSRSGTSMVHALTAGLTGWGLVEGFRHRKWGLLVRNFVLAVGLHGLWNGAALVAGLSIVNQEFQTPLPEGITVALSLGATLVVVLVAIGCFLGLIGVSRRLALDVRQAEGGAGSSEEALEPRRM